MPRYAASAEKDESAARASEARLYESVRYLADDAREGRGIGTAGLDMAADYIAGEFRAMGLKTDVVDGGPFQPFTMTTNAKMGDENHVSLTGPSGTEPIALELGSDFNPLAIGGSGTFDLPIVFVGYGITAKDLDYDDYAGLDVEGKAVLILRHVPQQGNPHSPFGGAQQSPYAPFTRKLSNAYEHGAAAVIFCTGEHAIREQLARRAGRWLDAIDDLATTNAKFRELDSPTRQQFEKHLNDVAQEVERIEQLSRRVEAERDPVLAFRGAGPGGEGARLPVIHARRKIVDQLLEASHGRDLASLEHEIDETLEPQSSELKGWRFSGTLSVDIKEAAVKNVVAVLEGEGPHADETVVVGAHYDHLGLGGSGSLAPTSQEVHNGADDNGSGTAGILEIARRFAEFDRKLPRRVIFIAFTGEERGLVGSAYYCRNPLFPLDQTVAMINLDMIGRLDENKLIIQGTDTAEEFEPLVDRLNEDFGFELTKKSGGHGPSDHSSFYGKDIPVMHFFTGIHGDYHRPSDDYDKVNVSGMRRITDMITDVVLHVATMADRPHYVSVGGPPAMGGGGDRPYFGSIPDFAQSEPGYAISGVTKDSPAAKAGLAGGDIILRFGESKIGGLEDFDSALRKYKAGDKVKVLVKRDGKEVELEVELDPPK